MPDRFWAAVALLDSSSEGERHAALAACNRMLGAKGLKWQGLRAALMVPPKPDRDERAERRSPFTDRPAYHCADGDFAGMAQWITEHPRYAELPLRHRIRLHKCSAHARAG